MKKKKVYAKELDRDQEEIKSIVVKFKWGIYTFVKK
jgi:hypothetical protein